MLAKDFLEGLWKQYLNEEIPLSKAVLGVGALEASLQQFWVDDVQMEWAQYKLLMKMFINDESLLSSFAQHFEGFLSPAQILASLNYLLEAGTKKGFVAKTQDLALLYALRYEHSASSKELCSAIFPLLSYEALKTSFFQGSHKANELIENIEELISTKHPLGMIYQDLLRKQQKEPLQLLQAA